VRERIVAARDHIDPSLTIWPGCSVTGARMAGLPGVHAVRPGTYVFNDLNLIGCGAATWNDAAVTVLATVVDRPEPNLALLDAGSKTFSSDKTPDGAFGAWQDQRSVLLRRPQRRTRLGDRPGCGRPRGW
jgi:D-serine deaminase-like pyridoxal phosphate-dependent protein